VGGEYVQTTSYVYRKSILKIHQESLKTQRVGGGGMRVTEGVINIYYRHV
jgi:hypothetical protein